MNVFDQLRRAAGGEAKRKRLPYRPFGALPPEGEARAAGEPVAGPLWQGAAFLWLPFWKGELSLQRLRG